VDLDLLIHGGTVVDGTGAPAYRADVGVKGDRIVAIGDLAEAAAASRIDATDRAVSPGFIDAHIHSETALRGNKDQLGSSYQGVTTHLTSPDGFGWAPLPPIDAQQLWRGTSFAEGNPGFRPAWHTVEDTPRNRELYVSHVKLLADIAEREHAWIIPNRRIYERARNNGHPNARGYQAMAHDIYDFLRQDAKLIR